MTQPTPDTPKLATTEVINSLRAEAYRRIADQSGDLVIVRTVAGPGDVITVDQEPLLMQRGLNLRDKGHLLGVNLSTQAEGRGEHTADITIGEGQSAVVVERPTRFDPKTGAQVSTFSMPAFYSETKAAYKQLLSERRARAQS